MRLLAPRAIDDVAVWMLPKVDWIASMTMRATDDDVFLFRFI